MTRILVRLINGIITLAVSLALAGAGLYAGYALWDNHQIYSAAESTQLEMLRYKPKIVVNDEGEVEPPSFEELLEINPDVCAWITMDNTAIDYPVLQGENNLTYINTNVYREFALSGSIFLDTRCTRSFKGNYNLLYGHHMDNHAMFGDVALYKDEAFFRENQTGMLLLPDSVHPLATLACIVTEASDDAIFEPDKWQETVTEIDENGVERVVGVVGENDENYQLSQREVGRLKELLAYCVENALFINDETMREFENRLDAGENPRIVAMSTCSGEYTNARTIVLTLMDYVPEAAADEEAAEDEITPEVGDASEA